jgi:sugar O-acyltransferase (sialic acid O-acetyltransferase NeuD family)
MIVVGAGGHAKEVLGVFRDAGVTKDIYLYDDVNQGLPEFLYGKFPILTNQRDAAFVLAKDPHFVLGIGNPMHRKALTERFNVLDGKLTSVISKNALIGSYQVNLGAGLNVMAGAIITEEITIGQGTLVHIHSSIHHNCTIGEFCEILPGCKVLGNVTIGDMTSIGSGATILPNIIIGSNVIVGAGAVVTKNIPSGMVVKGVPAR